MRLKLLTINYLQLLESVKQILNLPAFIVKYPCTELPGISSLVKAFVKARLFYEGAVAQPRLHKTTALSKEMK